jgi:hypothetical protein
MKTHRTTHAAPATLKHGTIKATVAAARAIPATFNPWRKGKPAAPAERNRAALAPYIHAPAN